MIRWDNLGLRAVTLSKCIQFPAISLCVCGCVGVKIYLKSPHIETNLLILFCLLRTYVSTYVPVNLCLATTSSHVTFHLCGYNFCVPNVQYSRGAMSLTCGFSLSIHVCECVCVCGRRGRSGGISFTSNYSVLYLNSAPPFMKITIKYGDNINRIN